MQDRASFASTWDLLSCSASRSSASINEGIAAAYRRRRMPRRLGLRGLVYDKGLVDPRRRFAYAFTIEQRIMRLWYANRAEVYVSEPFNVDSVRHFVRGSMCSKPLACRT